MWFEVTNEFARLPMWVFHGDADDVVPVSESLELVERVRALGEPAADGLRGCWAQLLGPGLR